MKSTEFRYEEGNPLGNTLTCIKIITAKAAVNALRHIGITLTDVVNGDSVYCGSVFSLKSELIGN